MKRFSHEAFATITGVVYLGLMVNFLLIVGALPFVVLLVTTDPLKSWPLLAIAAILAAPAVTGAFTAFREHGAAGSGPIRAFIAGWRATAKRSLTLGALVVVVVVVALVDVSVLSGSPAAVVVVPLLVVLAAIAVAMGLVALVAIAEAPKARMRDILRASLYLGVRRWYLTLVSLAVLGVQFALFATMPAIALGLTAAPALYLAWANTRYTLRPVLDTETVAAH